MVLYHVAFDLDYFWRWPVLQSLGIGGWLLARTSAILFLLIAGICAAISWERKPFSLRSTEPSCSSACAMQLRNSSRQRELDGKVRAWSISYHWKKVLRRFVVLASAAALVSFTTWLIAPQDFVKFGILHLFALATLLLPLFATFKHWNVIIGYLIILLSSYPLPTTPSLSIVLGSPPPSFSSLDYFPLIPWFGVILIGTAIGHILYLGKRAWRKKIFILHSQFFILNFVGRHALLAYLLHQPIILALLFLLLKTPSK